MQSQEIIAAQIDANGYGIAMRDLPPAFLTERETIDAETVTVNGRRVIVTFKKYKYRHYNSSHFAWRIEMARYVD